MKKLIMSAILQQNIVGSLVDKIRHTISCLPTTILHPAVSFTPERKLEYGKSPSCRPLIEQISSQEFYLIPNSPFTLLKWVFGHNYDNLTGLTYNVPETRIADILGPLNNVIGKFRIRI